MTSTGFATLRYNPHPIRLSLALLLLETRCDILLRCGSQYSVGRARQRRGPCRQLRNRTGNRAVPLLVTTRDDNGTLSSYSWYASRSNHH